MLPGTAVWRSGPILVAGETGSLRERVDPQASALEDVQAALTDQFVQLAALEERLDFAERVQARVGGAPAREQAVP